MHTRYRFRWSLRLGLFAGVMLSSLVCAQPMVCYVDSNPRHKSTQGTSWETALASLQAAIDKVAAAGGGEVWVKAGVYKPDGDGREASFVLKANVKLLGGFRGTESDRSQRNPRANRTVLSGDIGKTTDSDNCYHVVTAASGGLLDGFIISKGNANGLSGKGVGGGLLLPGGTTDFALANCTFEKNNAGWQGGGIFADTASLALTNCMFFSNTANSGAGLATKGNTTLRVVETFFSSNFSTHSGGAIEMQSGIEAFISGCSFMYNRSEGHGGAVSTHLTENQSAQIEIIDSIFNGNIAGKNAGAISFRGSFQPIISRCRFIENVGRQGAGAIANESAVLAIIEACVFKNNRGMPGQEDICTDESSEITDQRAAASEPEPQMHEQDEEPPAPQSMLPEIHVHREPGSTVLLSDLLTEKAFYVLVLGELTDPDFIENYIHIETAARDYASEDVGFFYIYRYLSRPENNGYLEPFHILERARQAQLAEELLGNRIPWLLDTMDNQAARELANDHNSIFIYSPDGRQQFAGSITDPAAFRHALENLAGEPGTTTDPGVSPSPALKPIELKPAEVVDRIQFNPAGDSFLPLEISPRKSRLPYYVKLRAEANDSLLNSGNGKIYLGFHVDPLYEMEWNNNEAPLKYKVSTSKGVLAPSENRAPRVTDRLGDSEPREFMLDARQLDRSRPLSIKIEYYVSSPDRRKREKVSQSYRVHLNPDPYAGRAYRRQIPYGAAATPAKKVSRMDLPPELKKYDVNHDGRISRKEVSGTLYVKFPDIDTDRDGYLSSEEYATYLRDR